MNWRMRFGVIIGTSLALMAQQQLPVVRTTVTVTASTNEPAIDNLNKAVFEDTLFSRDDQVFHQLNAGINAGQHEGGGKSIEVRRFGFNLDHGGVGGGMKILVDNVQQNQTTQGHGQGYLGSLKSMSPELIQEANLINGPFSAEYGDFSGLGVVHIRQREELQDQLTVRMQGGSFNTQRGFFAFSPDWKNVDSFFAYDGSHSDGPFVKPLDYRRDNLTMNLTRRLRGLRSVGFRFNGGLNGFNSSGQIPLDLVSAGSLDRFGFIDPGEGGKVRAATAAGYFRQENKDGAVWKIDGFATRSLFDLYSNFTFFLNDPERGDAIQQHDSRLVQGANVQYLRPHKFAGSYSYFTAGANFHANQINVGLYPRIGRDPQGITTAANANVVNTAGYVQENFSFLHGRLLAGAGLRFDTFRFDVRDRLLDDSRVTQTATRPQPKLSLAYTPTRRVPITLHANYGRGISSIDARTILTNRLGTKIATTDFYQAGMSSNLGRVSLAADAFWIDRSNEQVYIADDGTLEFFGPSRAYGFESKASVRITRHVSVSGGITKVFNAFYRDTAPRVYVDRAPHFTANGGITVSAWKGWTGSARVRAINSYILDGSDPSIRAAGHTVFDMSLVRRVNRNVDFNFSVDNFANRRYFETQNLVESRPFLGGAALTGIHATPGYPVTFTAGLTFRFRGK